MRRILSVVTLTLALGTAAVTAQDVTGTINGTVKDSTGATVAGATVTITDQEKKVVVRTVTTGDDGEYSAPSLPAGVYTVTVEAANFKKSAQTNVKLDVNQRRTLHVALEAGNISEVVTVQADPLTVELTTPTASTLISGDQVRELSLNNRNWVQLVTLAPGVSHNNDDLFEVGTTDPDTNNGAPNILAISVNGARQSSNTYTVDGADTTDRGSNITIQTYPSVDAIGEFKVLRSLYPAESGRSGGGQVNVVTRSGSNDFHGTLFEFVRNERMNANDYFTNQNANAGLTSEGRARRRPLRYNNFGGTFAGPLYLPRFGEGGPVLYDGRNRTFFFLSMEYRRDIRYPSLPITTVPDANLRRGIFPIPVCLTVNATGTCTEVLPANTQLAANRISPVSQSYVNEIYNNLPLPNLTNFQLAATARNQVYFNQQLIKFDHNFTKNLSGFYRFQNDSIPSIDANAIFSSGTGLPGVSTVQTKSPGRSHVARATWALTPSAIIEGGYSFSYGAIKSENIGLLARNNSPISVALPFTVDSDRVPSVSGNGFTALGGFGPYDNFSFNKSLYANTSLLRGTHTTKFGGNVSWYRKNENALAGINEGQFSGFSATLPAGVTASTINQNIQRFANFLVGTNATFTQARFDFTADLRAKNLELFGQDEWRVRPNLTLYYGARYSVFGQPVDLNGRLSNFDPALYNPAQAPIVDGRGTRSGTFNPNNGFIVNASNPVAGATISPWGEQVVKTDKGNIAPRVGLAWDPFHDGKTAVRTGYGIYHDQVLLGIYLNAIGLNPTYQQTVTINNTRLDNPLAGAEGTPSATVFSRVRGVQTNFQTPYTQHWSLDVQRQLTQKTVMTVGYYGSKGTHLPGLVDLNLLPPGFALTQNCRSNATAGSTTIVPCQQRGIAFVGGAAAGSPQNSNILNQIRPYRGYQSVEIVQTRFNSNYNSLQTFLQHRFTGASQVNVAYTFSKNLSDNRSDRSNPPQNPYDIRLDYGRANLDRRHILSVNYIYELPWFKDQRGAEGRLLGGWQFSGIVSYYTGVPFTATTSSFDASGVGTIPVPTAGNRPNQLCDPNQGGSHTQQQWFNTNCFSRNPATTATDVPNVLGNASINTIGGPPTSRVDLTVTKNVRLGESTRFQLRGEAFNLFNHTNFRAISTNVTASNFGAVTSTRDPRIIQLGVKFYF
ncbi:MAG: carboxypeptidase regulatory-like domain-containing protein [Pyrinomonadaceae bacterium]